MTHAHRPIDRKAKRVPLRTVCDELVDPMDRGMLSRQASTIEEADTQGVDCPGCRDGLAERVT